MKKSLVAAIILFILLGAGLGYTLCVISDQREDVRLWHQVLEGDITEAYGVKFHVKTQWTGRVFWDTEVTIGREPADRQTEYAVQGEACSSHTEMDTDWAMHSKRNLLFNWYGWKESPIYIPQGDYTDTYYGGISEEELAGMGMDFHEAIVAVAERTKAGETYTEEVRVADYAKYYPIEVNFQTSGKPLFFDESQTDILTEYFGIPIPDSYKMTITVAKTENGKIQSVSVSAEEDSDNGSILLSGQSLEMDEGFCFVYNVLNQDMQYIELKTKAGQGVFFIPLKEEKDKGWWELECEKITKVCDLPENCRFLKMELNEEGNLVLLSAEGEELIVRVLEPVTGKEKQKLTVMPYTLDMKLSRMDFTEQGAFVVFENGEFSFLALDGDEYREGITGSLGNLPGLEGNFEWQYALDYKDGRLAVVCAKDYYSCSSYVYVFDREGLQYKGYFTHSFDLENRFYNISDAGLQYESAFSIELP